jgi:hypothetical protein
MVTPYHNRIETDYCPHCEAEVDSATCYQAEVAPSPNDATVCLACAQVAIFGDDLKLRLPTELERREIKNNPQISELQRAIRNMDRRDIQTGKAIRREE